MSIRHPRDHRSSPLRPLEPASGRVSELALTRAVSYARQAPPMACLRCGAPITRADPRSAVHLHAPGKSEVSGVACQDCTVEIERTLRPLGRPLPGGR